MTRPELFSGIINLAASQWLLPANCISKIAPPTAASPPLLPCFLWDCRFSSPATPSHNLPIICTLWCGRLPDRLPSESHGCTSVTHIRLSPESQSPLSRVCVLAIPIVPSPLWVFLLTHIPSPCQGCISTTPTCAFPVASLLFPLSVPKEECLVFIAAYITVLPSQRLGHSLPVLRVSLGATVDGDLACVPDSLYSTRERCRGPHLSISILERRCCHWQVSHCPTVLVTFPLYAKAPRPRHLVGGKVIGGL